MKAVRKLRLILQVSQGQLADAAGISSRELARVEKGEVHPSRETAQRLDHAFDDIVNERLKTNGTSP